MSKDRKNVKVRVESVKTGSKPKYIRACGTARTPVAEFTAYGLKPCEGYVIEVHDGCVVFFEAK